MFDTRPEIRIDTDADGRFTEMALSYDPARAPMVLRRLRGDSEGAARSEAADVATMCGRADIAAAVESAATVLEWEVDRHQLDEDAWFALHLWQAWVLGRASGWLHAPGDGLFDVSLQRVCSDA